jgi:Transposase DDE domain
LFSIFPSIHNAGTPWTFPLVVLGVTAITNPISPPPHAPAPLTSKVADPTHLLDLFRQLLPPNVPNDIDSANATLFTPWLVTWLMVWQRSQGNASLGDAVAEIYLGPTFNALPDCKRVRDQNISVNTSAYSQARSRLSLDAALHAADHVFTHLTADLAPAWKGRPAYLIDGSSLTLAHHPELVAQFPPAINQHGASHWPVVRFVVAHELSTGFAPRWEYGPMYGPNATSETALAGPLLSRLPPEALIVYDRNFGIFGMTYVAVQAGHDVVVRMTDTRFRALTRGREPTRPGEWVGVWRPSRWDRQSNAELPADAAVSGRFVAIRVKHQGKEFALMLFTTDLTATPEELAALYRKRWDIESDIRDVKQTLNMDILTGRRVEMVEKEMVLGVVAYNLTLQVRRLAGARAGVPVRELSFRRTLGLVQAFARGTIGGSNEQLKERFERLLKGVGSCRHPRRPNRSYPRELIPRGRSFPQKKRDQVVNKKS